MISLTWIRIQIQSIRIHIPEGNKLSKKDAFFVSYIQVINTYSKSLKIAQNFKYKKTKKEVKDMETEI